MIDYNPEEVYEKEMGESAFVYSVSSYMPNFVRWQTERNKELVEALIECVELIGNIEGNDDTDYRITERMRPIIDRNIGKKIEEVL